MDDSDAKIYYALLNLFIGLLFLYCIAKTYLHHHDKKEDALRQMRRQEFITHTQHEIYGQPDWKVDLETKKME